MKLYAQWMPDCQGKQDFDGPLISVSTRYWPDFTAHSSIILRLGPKQPNDGGGDYLVWRDRKFSGDTEAEVKSQVEAWAKMQMEDIVGLLGGEASFRKP